MKSIIGLICLVSVSSIAIAGSVAFGSGSSRFVTGIGYSESSGDDQINEQRATEDALSECGTSSVARDGDFVHGGSTTAAM